MPSLLQGFYLSPSVQPESCRSYRRIPARLQWCLFVGLLLSPFAQAAAQCKDPATGKTISCGPRSYATTGYTGTHSGGGDQPTGPKQSTGPTQPTGPTQEPTQVIVVPPSPVFPGCNSAAPGESERRAEMLDKQGPQMPQLFSLSSFGVMGFSKGNWPIVVDYLLEEDSLLLVVISPEGQKPLTYRLDGRKGHWQTRIQLPPSVGDQLRVSQYLVQTLGNNVGQVSPSHVHIHGIAAGPKAVGSIGIDQVDFGPANIRLAQHQHAQYSFHSMFDFKNTEVTIVRLAKSTDGEIVAASVGSKSMGSITQNARKNGEWDGSIKTDQIVKSYPPEVQKWLEAPNGQHALQVRAWFGVRDGGDWVTALSESIVSVE